MELTICLWTRGREKYLNQILNSFEDSLLIDEVKILILNNGATQAVSQNLSLWQKKFSDRVTLMKIDINDPRPTTAWRYLELVGADWVTFPSDDDQFLPSIIEEWRKVLRGNSNIVAFGSSVAIMNSEGGLTGETISPAVLNQHSSVEKIATALFEPPFHWPSLIFRLSKMPKDLPTSRFAFDWWVGISLILSGEVVTSPSIGLIYRTHNEQESNLVLHRRKYFEASIWIDWLVNTDEFKDWIKSLSDEDRVKLWKKLVSKNPIYGSQDYSSAVLASIFRIVVESTNCDIKVSEIIGTYAIYRGVLLRDNETRVFLPKLKSLPIGLPGNIRVTLASEGCTPIIEGSALIQGGESPIEFRIYCNHSPGAKNGVYIDCRKFNKDLTSLNADLIVKEITEIYERERQLQTVLTGGERILVFQFRKWRHKLPKALIKGLKLFKSRN